MKLYRVTIRGSNSEPAYVVAPDPTAAHEKVVGVLRMHGLGTESCRELKSVELLADSNFYGACGTVLYL